MIRKFIILFALLALQLPIHSQDYHPFPESDAYWRYFEEDIPDYCPCMGICREYQYIITGDTLINNLTYHKIKQSGFYYVDFCDTIHFDKGYQGAYRNVIEDKKVYFIDPDSDSEQLLYDFDLNTGDTLPISYLNPDMDCYVYDIDSVLVGNSFRQRIKFNCVQLYESDFYMIEGIGGMDLIASFESWFHFESGSFFSCINMNDSLIFPTGALCDLITSEKEPHEYTDFEVFPNPTQGKSWVSSKTNRKNQHLIEIYNPMGEKLAVLISTEPQIEIDLSGYPKGMYLVRIKIGSEDFIQKIILQ